MHESIIEAVIEHAKEDPDKLAIAGQGGKYSYRELVEVVSRAVQWMHTKGFRPGDYILVECTQNMNYLVIVLALEYIGCIFVPVEKDATKQRVKAIYDETHSKCIISLNDYSDILEMHSYQECFEEWIHLKAISLQYKPVESVGEILFTTGTTGKSKGVVVSRKANIATAENIISGEKMEKDAVEIVTLPLSHARSLNTSYANLYNGSSIVIIDGIMNVGLFFQLIETYHVNALNISPTVANVLFKIAKKGLRKISDQIEYLTIGTAVVEENVKEQLKEYFPHARLYNSYGASECQRTCFLDFNAFDAEHCIGYPAIHSEFFVVDENKKKIQSSKENLGYIVMGGDTMMDGYLNEEELTKKTVINGFLYTNDLGYIDEEGRVYIIGRADDVINYKGIKIAPDEIEAVALKYEGIKECACIAKEDQLCGQVPKLFVSLSSEINEKEFMNYLKENLEQMRVPACIEIVDEIPKTSNGKLLRRELREYEQKQ